MTIGNRWEPEMAVQLGFQQRLKVAQSTSTPLYLLEAQNRRNGAKVGDSPLALAPPPCTFTSTQSSSNHLIAVGPPLALAPPPCTFTSTQSSSNHLIAVGRESLALAPIFGPVFQLGKAFLPSAASFSASVLTTKPLTLSQAFLPQRNLI